MFYGIFLLDGKLVIQPEDIDNLDAAMVEAKATLVKKIIKKGDCEGSQVGRRLISREEKLTRTSKGQHSW